MRKKRDALVAEVVQVAVLEVDMMLEAITDQAAISRLLSTLNFRPTNADHVRKKFWLLNSEVTFSGGSG